METKIEEHKILLPVFNDLLKKDRRLKEQIKDWPFLPPSSSDGSVAEIKPTINDTDKISSVFQKIAQKNHFRIEAIQPDENLLSDNSKYLIIRITMRGKFLNLYNFLIQTLKIPYMAHIEQIQVQADQESEGDTHKISLKIWLEIQ
ncbi:hypothetical protein [Desulfonema magnum]|nr:hypothetical protein [Desulfonema magnum]